MAESTRPAIECGYCLRRNESLEKPKQLPCGHIHCYDCLDGSLQTKKIVECPDCKEVLNDPIHDLPDAEIYIKQSQHFCDSCKDKKPAKVYCAECNKKFCEQHKQDHNGLFSDHSDIEIQEYSHQLTKEGSRNCPQHNQSLKFGCKRCVQILCEDCVDDETACNGSAHQPATLKKLLGEVKNKVFTVYKQAEQKRSELLVISKETQRNLTTYAEETEVTRQKICQTRDEQLQAISTKYADLETEFLQRRKAVEEELVKFNEDKVEVELSQLNVHLQRMVAGISNNHVVDVISKNREMRRALQRDIKRTLPSISITGIVEVDFIGRNEEINAKISSTGGTMHMGSEAAPRSSSTGTPSSLESEEELRPRLERHISVGSANTRDPAVRTPASPTTPTEPSQRELQRARAEPSRLRTTTTPEELMQEEHSSGAKSLPIMNHQQTKASEENRNTAKKKATEDTADEEYNAYSLPNLNRRNHIPGLPNSYVPDYSLKGTAGTSLSDAETERAAVGEDLVSEDLEVYVLASMDSKTTSPETPTTTTAPLTANVVLVTEASSAAYGTYPTPTVTARAKMEDVITTEPSPISSQAPVHTPSPLRSGESTTKGFLAKGVQSISTLRAPEIALPNGTVVTVMEGDLTKMKCDAIVSSSGPDLSHKYGVSKAIAKACGQKFSTAGRQWISKNGVLHDGDAHVQKADGTLSALGVKYIIHAIAPLPEKMRQPKVLLVKTIRTALDEAERHKCQTVAFPAICAGRMGVPIATCAECYWIALAKFSSSYPEPSLQHIFFVVDNSVFKTEIYHGLNSRAEGVNMGGDASAVDTQYNEDRYSEESRETSRRSRVKSSLDAHGAGAYGRQSPSEDSKLHEEKRGIIGSMMSGVSSMLFGTKAGAESAEDRLDERYLERSHSSLPYEPRHQTSSSRSSRLAPGKDSTARYTTAAAAVSTKPSDKECPICMDDMTKPITLSCSHKFCKNCIDEMIKTSKSNLCPTCRAPFMKAEGQQPKGGRMTTTTSLFSRLPGYESYGTITINYYIPSGTQGREHPNPGYPYSSTSRTAYLPDNTQGRRVEKLLRKAFEQRLVFTIGRSVTTGQDNCVVWNDIHHKTNKYGGSSDYGYPDPGYLDRVIEDLKAKGVTD